MFIPFFQERDHLGKLIKTDFNQSKLESETESIKNYN